MKDLLKRFKLSEQNISMGLGVVVVVIVGSLLFNYFRSVNKVDKGTTSSAATESAKTEGAVIPVPTNLPADYVVQKGDTLWSIAQKAYGSGYNWVDAYAANKQAIGNNPDALVEGTKLTLPQVEAKKAVAETTTKSYTVVKGDNLWTVGVKLCNNGYVWPMIAQVSAIKNPNVIEVGQVLKVVCN